jgi:hypothetical protein
VGADHIAKSAPDGYSLLIGAVATHAINPSLYARMPYDAERDFTPISLIAVVPNVLVLNGAFAKAESIRSVDDFIAVLKRKPGAFQFASGGNGSAGHLAGELFKQQTQTFAVHIPYRGAGPAQLALMSGEVQFMFDNLASAAARIREGKISALGITTPGRTAAMPELAPLAELAPQSLKGFDISTWYGLFAPANTPRPIVERIHAALHRAMAVCEAGTMSDGWPVLRPSWRVARPLGPRVRRGRRAASRASWRTRGASRTHSQRQVHAGRAHSGASSRDAAARMPRAQRRARRARGRGWLKRARWAQWARRGCAARLLGAAAAHNRARACLQRGAAAADGIGTRTWQLTAGSARACGGRVRSNLSRGCTTKVTGSCAIAAAGGGTSKQWSPSGAAGMMTISIGEPTISSPSSAALNL